jgi:hypothetical protein
MTSETRKITRNTKNSTCATPAAVLAIPPNPKKGGDNRDDEEYQCPVEHIILH